MPHKIKTHICASRNHRSTSDRSCTSLRGSSFYILPSHWITSTIIRAALRYNISWLNTHVLQLFLTKTERLTSNNTLLCDGVRGYVLYRNTWTHPYALPLRELPLCVKSWIIELTSRTFTVAKPDQKHTTPGKTSFKSSYKFTLRTIFKTIIRINVSKIPSAAFHQLPCDENQFPLLLLTLSHPCRPALSLFMHVIIMKCP